MATESKTLIGVYDATEDLQLLESELHRKVTDEMVIIKSELSKFVERFNPKLRYHMHSGMVGRPFNEKALVLLARIYNVVYIKNEEIEGTNYIYFGPNLDGKMVVIKQ
jgi:hypothetical protein